MRKAISILLLSLAAIMGLSAATPDFAYPQTVIADCEKRLSSLDGATGQKADISRAECLLDIVYARGLVDQQSYFNAPALVDSVARQITDPAVRALVRLIDADVYSSIYNASAYRYDQVKTPDQPLPADISEWNGRQFRAVIDSLVNEAVALDSVAGRQPLADFSAIINAGATERYLYPTVYDFIALKASGLMQNGDAAAPMRRALARSPRRSAPWFNWQLRLMQMQPNYDRNKTLKKLYFDNKDCEASGIVLMELTNHVSEYQKSFEPVFNALKEYIAVYPQFIFIDILKNNLSRIGAKSVSIRGDKYVSPGKPFSLAVNYSFAPKVGYILYKIPNGVTLDNIRDLSAYKTDSYFIDTDASKGDCDTTLTVTLSKPGTYYIAPAVDSAVRGKERNGIEVSAVPFIPFLVKGDSPELCFMDLEDGHPVAGVEVFARQKKQTVRLGRSNADGRLKVSGNLLSNRDWNPLTYKKDSYTYNCFNRPYASQFVNDDIEVNISTKTCAQIFTDRAIYHPGDSVCWSILVYDSWTEKERNEVRENYRTVMALFDANSQLIDTVVVTTGDYGCASGRFMIPEGRLTGNYYLKVGKNVSKTAWSDGIGTKYITVSDFKLRTFKVEIDSVRRDCPSEGEVTIKGRAVTYAGMPVASAKVYAQINALEMMWRWFYPQDYVGELDAVTDAGGGFELVIPENMLDDDDYKFYRCNITVTSADGESVDVCKNFSVGKPYDIYSDADLKINTDMLASVPVKVSDADNREVTIPLRWSIRPDRKGASAEASGEFMSDKGLSADLSRLDSGDYELSIWPVDTVLADTLTVDVALYSIARNTLPESKNAFFVPAEKQITADADGSFTITIGTTARTVTYLYSAFNDGKNDNVIDMKKAAHGFNKCSFRLADGCNKGCVIFYTVRDGNVYVESYSVTRAASPAPAITMSSFRDRLVPGNVERWTLNFKDKGRPSQGAFVATMYNSALDALTAYNWGDIESNAVSPNIQFVYSDNYMLYGNLTLAGQYYRTISLSLPRFDPAIDYYRMSRLRIRGVGKMSKNSMAVTDEVAYDGAVMELNETVSMAYGVAPKSSMVSAETEEAEMDESAENVAQPDNFEYREGEVLQAFWKPDLTFDAEGNSVISFTVPDANATWSFRAFAWTKDVSTATLFKEIISNKPVMVTPQLPRFLRAGDKARMIANVFNNSDSTITATTVVEIFDTNSGAVTRSVTSTDTIAPMASAPVSIEVAADGNASAIGYRVRSTSGRFSDGEQDYIAVMPSTSDVIESDNFYLNPGENDYSVRLPKGKMESVTLEYNASPAWEVIKQLPALAVCESYTSTGAARRLFGAAVSSGLLKKYPALARAIETWSADSASRALVSRLSRNEDLKTAALTETPWVQAAQSDSERMARLVALLDSKAVARNMAASIARLKTLKAADGGWRWGEWESKGNAWSTRSTLYSLGQLNAIGMMPADKELKAMIESAFAFLDSKTTKIYPDLALSATLAMFPDHELSLRERQIVNATTAYINKEYRKFGTAEKARAAIVLDAFSYKAMARQLMESVAQFGVSSKDKGTSFPSVTNVDSYADLLFAFARIEPQSSAIDGMRQWLVVRGQATSRLGSFDPTRLIAAFEMTGSDWNVSGAAPTVTLGGEAVSVGSVEPVTGHLIAQLPTDASGKKLAVVRDNTAGPAYGAVISRYVSASTDVKAVKCDGLSIEKRLTLQRGDRWEYADSLRLGDRVRVLLTIKADRDLEYVTVVDERPASFEPVNQLPGYVYSAGLGFYRENNDTDTRLFVGYMPKGTYQITTEMTVGFAGEFTSGIATAQSSLDPAITAHSSGRSLICR